MKRFFIALMCFVTISSASANQEDCRALAEAQKKESKELIMSYWGLGWMNVIAMGQLLDTAEKHYAQSVKNCPEQTK